MKRKHNKFNGILMTAKQGIVNGLEVCRNISKSLLMVMVLVFVLGLSLWPNISESAAAWFDSNWGYRKSITVDNSKVPSDQTDFPMLINLSSDVELSNRAQADADDILFTASDGTTQLDHEIESYNSGTGALTAWVEIPLITAATSTTIYMYYGNGLATNQENAVGTWNSTYQGVWHMAEDPSITTDGDCQGGSVEACDSTNNSIDGDSFGTMTTDDLVTGQINGALQLDGIDDYIGIADSGTLDISDDLSFTAWIKPESQAAGGLGSLAPTAIDTMVFADKEAYETEIYNIAGDIYAAVYSGTSNDGFITTFIITTDGTIQSGQAIDTFEFDAAYAFWPEMINVVGDVYAIAYYAAGGDGFVTTFTINSSGEISNSVIDSYEFDTVQASRPKILKVSSGIFAVAYDGNFDGKDLVTFSIDSSGNIASSNIDEIVFGDITAYDVEVYPLSGTTYAVLFRGSGNDGYITTMDISSSGSIEAGKIIDSLEFDTTDGLYPDMVNISGDIYAIVYRGGDNDGWITTIEMSSSGVIKDTIIDTFEFESEFANFPTIAHVTGNIFAVSYDSTTAQEQNFVTLEISTAGIITKSVQDSMHFGDTYSFEQEILHISGDVYAIVYRGPSNDGYVTTIDISTSGDIDSGVVKDVLEFDTSNGYNPEIINVSGDIYAIAYRGVGNDGFLVTVEIDTSGNITDSVIDSFEFSTADANFPSLVNVSGDIYAIIYTGADNDGYIATVDIATDGTIAGSVVDVYEFDTVQGLYPELFNISGSVFGLTYQGSGSDGFLSTINIANDGTITNSLIDTLEFDTTLMYYSDVINISGDIYSVIYYGSGNDGYIVTIEIDSSGNITSPVIDSWELNTSQAITPKMINVTGTLYAAVYDGPGADGFVDTFAISNGGTIDKTIIDSFEFDEVNADAPDIIPVSGNVYAIAYAGTATARINTITISGTGAISDSHVDQGMYGYGQFTYDEYPSIAKVSDGIVAVYFAGLSQDGVVRTMQIDSSGSIVEDFVDYFEFNTSQARYGNFINISGTTFGVVARGNSNFGTLDTFTINSDGSIPKSRIDTFAFNSVVTSYPKLLSISGTLKAIVYEDVFNDGHIATVGVTDGGVITPAILDDFEFESNDADWQEPILVGADKVAIFFSKAGVARVVTVDVNSGGDIAESIVDIADYGYGSFHGDVTPEFVHISGDYYALFFGGLSNDGMLKTVEINSAGNVVDGFVDFFEYDIIQALDPSVVNVSGNIYAVAYRGNGNDGYVTTLEISTTGTIGQVVNDTWEFETTDIFSPKLINVSGDTYAIAYEDVDGDGQVATLQITGTGGINKTLLDKFEFDDDFADTPDIINVSADVYAITYEKDGVSEIKTIEITTGGVVTGTLDQGDFGARGSHYDVTPRMINVSGDVYAVVYSGFGADGIVKTIRVDNNGNVIDGFVDKFQFDSVNADNADIIHISGDVYAIIYEGNGNDGYIVTVNISTEGLISKTLLDSWEYQTSQALTPQIINISGTTYAIVYEDPSGDGQVATVTIANDGTITKSFVDSLEFDTVDGDTPDIINVSGDIYAIAYDGNGDDGFIVTVDIDAAGNISNAVLDSLEFDPSTGQTPDLFAITGTMVAIAYDGPSDDGFLATVNIDAAGNISNAVVDSLEYNVSQGQYPTIASLGNDIYAIAYEGSGDDGFISTVSITTDGTIGSGALSTLEYDTTNGMTPQLLNLGTDLLMVVYNGGDGPNSADLQMIQVISDTDRGLYKGNAYKIDANSDTVYATINSTTINSASTVSGAGWEHVAMTYDRDAGSNQLRLYLSGTLAAQQTLSDAINVNSDAFNIGEFFIGEVDEVRLANTSVLSADWIRTEYENQSDPSGFYLLGPERTQGVKTWGGGTNVPPTGFWNVAANWTGDTVPTTSDLVNFDDTAITDCVIDVAVDVGGFDVSAGYSGVISQGANMVTVGTLGYNQNAATFTGGSASMNVNGPFVVSNALFTSTSGTLSVSESFTISGTAAFNHNSGSLQVEGSLSADFATNNSTFQNLSFVKMKGASSTVSLNDSFTVLGTLSINKDDVDNFIISPTVSGTLTLQGSLVMGNTSGSGMILFGAPTWIVDFTGINSQTILQTAGTFNSSIQINKSAGVLSLTSDFQTVGSSADCTVVEGVFYLNTNDFACGGDFMIQDNATIRLDGNETVTTPSFTAVSVAEYVGTNPTETILSWNYNELQINGAGGTFTLSDDLNVSGSLQIQNGTLHTDGYDLNITGTMDIDATLDASSGSGNDTVIRVGGNWDMTSGVFTNTNSQVVFTGTDTHTIISDSKTFNDFTINDGLVGYWKLDENSGLAKDTSGYGNDGTWGGTPISSTDTNSFEFKNSKSLEFDGATDFVDVGDPAILRGMDQLTVSVWVKQKSTGSVQTIIGYWGNTSPINSRKYMLRVSTSSIQGYVYTTQPAQEGGTFSTTDLTDGWHHLAMTWDGSNLRMYIDGVDTGVTFTGTGAINSNSQNDFYIGREQASGIPFNGFIDEVRIYNRALSLSEISNLASGQTPSSFTGTYTIQDVLNVDGTLQINAGQLDTGTNLSVNVAGNWENNGGVFTPNTSTVMFDGGDQEITTSETFYNFDKSVSMVQTITFAEKSIVTTLGTLKLQGTAGNLLNIRSSKIDEKAQLDPQGGRNISFVDVRDNENINMSVIDCTNNCVDSGDNIQWDFGLGNNTISGTLYSDEGSTVLTSTGVAVSINGAPSSLSGMSNAVTGTFTISYTASSIVADDVLSVYIDNETEKGVTVTVADGNSMSGIGVYQDYLIIRNDNGGTLDSNQLDIANNSLDPDIDAIYTMTGSLVMVAEGKELLVPENYTFDPGFNIDLHDLDVDGTLNLSNLVAKVSGSWDTTGGTFIESNSTVIFTGTTDETLSASGQVFNDLMLNEGLILYWPFEEISSPSIDISGYQNNGDWFSQTTFSSQTPTVSFINARSIEFDGDDDYIDILDSVAGGHDFTDIGNNNDYTIAVWINSTGGTAGGSNWIPNDVIIELAEQGVTGIHVPFSFGISSNVLHLGRSNNYTSGDEVELGTVTVNDGEWHHVAAVVTGNTVDFYVDGALDVSRTFVTAIGDVSVANATSNMQVGVATTTVGIKNFNDYLGLMDDLRLYNRALSAAEILRLGQGHHAGDSIGSVTLSNSLDVNGDIYLYDGDLRANTNDITLQGNWNGFGGQFTGGTATVVFDGSSGVSAVTMAFDSFNHFQVDDADGGSDYVVVLGGSLNIDGNLTLTDGSLDSNSDKNHVIVLGGDWMNRDTFVPRSGTVLFGGSTDQTVDPCNACVVGDFANVEITNSTATVNFLDSFSLNNLKATTADSSITFEAGQTISIAGTMNMNGGAPGDEIVLNSSDGSTRFELDVARAQVVNYVDVSNSEASTNDIVAVNSINRANTDGVEVSPRWLFGSLVSVSGVTNYADATVIRAAVNNILQSSTTTVAGGAWMLSNVVVDTDVIVTVWGDGVADALESTAVTKYNGTGNITGMVLNTGTLSMGSDDDPMSINMTELGQYDNNDDEDIVYVLTAGNTLNSVATGMGLSIQSNGTFITDGYDLNVDGTITIQGTLSAENGLGGSTRLDIASGWDSSSGVFMGAGSTVIFTGTGNVKSYSIISGGQSFDRMIINDGGGMTTWNLTGDLQLTGTLELVDGVLDTNSMNNYTVAVGGDWLNSGAMFVANTSTVRFDGTNSVYRINSNGDAFYNLEFDDGGAAMTIWELQDDLDVDGSIIIVNGTLDVGAGNRSINVAKNWNNSGAFIARSGTVVFDGLATQQITTGGEAFATIVVMNGSASSVQFVDSFSVMNMVDITPNSVLIFGAGTTVTITNNLNLNGQSAGTPIILDSSDGATRFSFNVTGGVQQVDFVNVSNAESLSNNIRTRRSIQGANTDAVDNPPQWTFGPLRGSIIIVE